MNGVANNPGLVNSQRDSMAPCRAIGMYPFRALFFGIGILSLCFSKPLFDLARLALTESIHSHILLIPLISAYLIWQQRFELPKPETRSSRVGWVTLALAAVALAAPLFIADTEPINLLALRILAYWLFLVSVTTSILGSAFARAIGFPIGFLLFMIPLPPAIIKALEIAFQHSSAEVFSWILSASHAPFYREGTVFLLPNQPIHVAQECSGIRSNLALFMTSLLAGNILLRSPKRRLLLALAIFPVGVLRNAFRIYVLSMLTIYWDRDVLNSPLHHKGGPLFFAISLVPLFLLIYWFRKSERKNAAPTPKGDSAAVRPNSFQ